MVARLCRLRLTLLVAEFRGSFWRGVRSVFFVLLMFALVIAVLIDRVARGDAIDLKRLFGLKRRAE